MLTAWLLDCLGRMRHSSGAPVVRVYGPLTGIARGGTVALNFLDPDGRVIDERAVPATRARPASRCGPAASATPARGRPRSGSPGVTCGPPGGRCRAARGTATMDHYLSLVGLPTGGAVRVSLGVASTLDDVDAFLDFAERTYRDRRPDLAALPPRHSC